MTATIRPVTPDDLLAVRALNAANVPEVGVLDDDRVRLFATAADAFWVALERGEVVGLFVGLFSGHDYDSPNYRWFATRHQYFAYVDRIALAPSARGTGLADALYERWAEAASAAHVPVMCAEVNILPPNPPSLAFHRRRGFVSVAEFAPYGPSQRVAMLERML